MDRWKFEEVAFGSTTYEATVALRQQVLRAPLGMRITQEELALERWNHHLVCYDGDVLAGCLLLVPQGEGVIKMRQVAIAPEARGRGIGRGLVGFAEGFARQREFRLMTLHARETAVPFYEKLGYERVGERFEEVSLAHWEMQKGL